MSFFFDFYWRYIVVSRRGMVEIVAGLVEKALDDKKTKEEFIEFLREKHVEVHWGRNAKYITFVAPDGEHIRNCSLEGKTSYDCSTKGLCERFGEVIPSKILREEGVLPPIVSKKNITPAVFFGTEQGISNFCLEYEIAEKGQRFLYVLGLQDDCYYIGQTGKFRQRMRRHFVSARAGSDWTEVHSPICVVEVIELGTLEEDECVIYETAKTVEYMQRYGITSVRGGDFCLLQEERIRRNILKFGFSVNNDKPEFSLKSQKYLLALKEVDDKIHKYHILLDDFKWKGNG